MTESEGSGRYHNPTCDSVHPPAVAYTTRPIHLVPVAVLSEEANYTAYARRSVPLVTWWSPDPRGEIPGPFLSEGSE